MITFILLLLANERRSGRKTHWH